MDIPRRTKAAPDVPLESQLFDPNDRVQQPWHSVRSDTLELERFSSSALVVFSVNNLVLLNHWKFRVRRLVIIDF